MMKERKIIKRLEKLQDKVRLLRAAEPVKMKNPRLNELYDAEWHIYRAQEALARAAEMKSPGTSCHPL